MNLLEIFIIVYLLFLLYYIYVPNSDIRDKGVWCLILLVEIRVI